MKKYFYSLLIILVAIICVFAVASVAKADVPSISNIKLPTSHFQNLGELIVAVINWLLTLCGALAVVAIIYSGIMYITAGGDSEKAATARKNITWAVIGIVVVLLSLVTVAWVNGITSGKVSSIPSDTDPSGGNDNNGTLSPLSLPDIDPNGIQKSIMDFLNNNGHNLTADQLNQLGKQLISQLPPQLQGEAQKVVNKYQDQIQAEIDKQIQNQVNDIFNSPSQDNGQSDQSQAVDEANMSAGEQEIEDYFNSEDEEDYIYEEFLWQ